MESYFSTWGRGKRKSKAYTEVTESTEFTEKRKARKEKA